MGRSKIKRLRLLIFSCLAIVFFLISCDKSDETVLEDIQKSILIEIIDSLEYRSEIGELLAYEDSLNRKLTTIMINDMVNYMIDSEVTKNEVLLAALSDFGSNYSVPTSFTIQTPDLKIANYGENHNLPMLDITSFYINDQRSTGIFYFGIHCGENCGSGSLVIVKFSDNINDYEYTSLPVWN